MNTTLLANIIAEGATAQNMVEIASHGADNAIGGILVYYVETEAFYDANKAEILEQLEDSKFNCCESDTSTFDMISGFGRGGDLEVETSELYDNDDGELESQGFDNEVIFTTTDYDMMHEKAFIVDTTFKNLMAWFALEEVSRFISDMLEEAEEDCYHSDTTMTNIEYVKSLGIDCQEWEENNS